MWPARSARPCTACDLASSDGALAYLSRHLCVAPARTDMHSGRLEKHPASHRCTTVGHITIPPSVGGTSRASLRHVTSHLQTVTHVTHVTKRFTHVMRRTRRCPIARCLPPRPPLAAHGPGDSCGSTPASENPPGSDGRRSEEVRSGPINETDTRVRSGVRQVAVRSRQVARRCRCMSQPDVM